jgi:hypothetical protein
MRRHAEACRGFHVVKQHGRIVDTCNYDEAADVLEVA